MSRIGTASKIIPNLMIPNQGTFHRARSDPFRVQIRPVCHDDPTLASCAGGGSPASLLRDLQDLWRHSLTPLLGCTGTLPPKLLPVGQAHSI